MYGKERCDCCGSFAFSSSPLRRQELDLTGQEHTVRYLHCSRCGAIRKSPMPSSQDLDLYYGTAWQSSSSRPRECFELAAKYVLDYVAKGVPGAPREIDILDVGGKDGLFGECFAALRPETLAIRRNVVLDPNPLPPKRGMYAIQGSLGSLSILPHVRAYEIVVACHVLEHVPDPVLFLSDLRKMTDSETVVYVEVPSLFATDLSSDNICRAHLWHFGAESLKAAAHLAGFDWRDVTVFGPAAWDSLGIILRRRTADAPHETLDAFIRQSKAQQEEYEKAALNLRTTVKDRGSKRGFIWGACEALFQVFRTYPLNTFEHRNLSTMPVVDRAFDRRYEMDFWKPQNPDAIAPNSEYVLVGAKYPASVEAIEKDIREHFPHLEIVRLFV